MNYTEIENYLNKKKNALLQVLNLSNALNHWSTRILWTYPNQIIG